MLVLKTTGKILMGEHCNAMHRRTDMVFKYKKQLFSDSKQLFSNSKHTAVMVVSKIIGLYNVKTILTDNSI